MTAAARALEGVLALLEDAGVSATRDAGSFNPAPIGVLVGLPERVRSTLRGVVFEVAVLVVSGDPLNEIANVDRLYAEADAIADVLQESSYRTAQWAGSGRVEPLPAIQILATVTVSNEEE